MNIGMYLREFWSMDYMPAIRIKESIPSSPSISKAARKTRIDCVFGSK